MKKILPVLALVVVALSACMKDTYNLENMETDGFQPSLALPLLNTTIEFSNFLGGIDTLDIIEKDSNELIHVVVTDSLFSYQAADLLSAPSQTINESFNVNPIELDSINTQTAVELQELVNNMEEPEKSTLEAADGGQEVFPPVPNEALNAISIPASDDFSEISLSKGILSIEITNNWPVAVTNVQIELRNNISNEIIDTFVYDSIAPTESDIQTVNLAGRTLESSLSANVLNVSSPGSQLAQVDINLQDELNLDIIIDSLVIISGDAIFPSQEIYNDTNTIDFDLGNGEIIETITFSDGSFNFNFTHSIQENARLQIQIPSLSKDGVVFDQLINLVPNGGTAITADSVNLTDYVMDLTTGDTNTLEIILTAEIVSSNALVTFDTSQSIQADITIDGMTIAAFTGNLGTRSLDLAGDTFDIDFSVGGLEGLSFAAPKVTLAFANSIGVPVGIDLTGIEMIGEDGNANVLSGSITDNAATVTAPSLQGDTSLSSITLNRENSNVADLLNSTPSGIIANISADLNSTGNGENFVTNSGAIDMTMDIDVPLYVSIEDFGMADTIEIGEGMLQGFKSAEFLGRVDNGLPVDLDLQIYMMDSNFIVFDSLMESSARLADAALVEITSGDVIGNTLTDISIMADSAKLAHFNLAKYLLMDVSLATPDNGNTAAKLYTTASIGIQLGINTQISINDLIGNE